MADLRKCCPKTISPLRHGDSFYPSFPSLFFFSKVRISLKVTIAYHGFYLLRHTKTSLAHDMMFSCVLYYFKIFALDKIFLLF